MENLTRRHKLDMPYEFSLYVEDIKSFYQDTYIPLSITDKELHIILDKVLIFLTFGKDILLKLVACIIPNFAM